MPLPLRAVFGAAALTLLPTLGLACSTANTGARCITVAAQPAAEVQPTVLRSASVATPLVDVGEVLPRGRYNIILNADYYGLPPVRDGWVYMRVGQDAFRVDWRSHTVLERVTDRVAANF